MGRYAPGTAQADWVICVGDMSYLDATSTDPGFAAFGQVTDGMPVVRQILGEPTDPNAGVGAMKGEILVHPVKIVSIRRAPPAPPADPAAAPAPATPAAPKP
jgi:peptidyl-prolyl cis-trans isomerase A (cyclophilin A)